MSSEERQGLLDTVATYIKQLESSSEWIEVENRPWANENTRWKFSGALGYDFVMYDPRIKMRFFWHETSQTLSGCAHWDNRTEGPPGGSHGASIMLVFDEILAYPVWRLGEPAFTANVNINLRRMIPFNAAVRFTAKIVKSERRKRYIKAQLLNGEGNVIYADAIGLWVLSNGIGGSMAVRSEQVTQHDVQRSIEAKQHAQYFQIIGNSSTTSQYDHNNNQQEEGYQIQQTTTTSQVIEKDGLPALPSPHSSIFPSIQNNGNSSHVIMFPNERWLAEPYFPSAAIIGAVPHERRLESLQTPNRRSILPFQHQQYTQSLAQQLLGGHTNVSSQTLRTTPQQPHDPIVYQENIQPLFAARL